MKKKIFTFILLASLTLTPETMALSRRGSRGSEVRNIQSRLKQWGYMSGPVDGIYGEKTEAGVKKFQRKHKDITKT